ncbi:hypothetical protein MM236_02450 [Belliella sp. DSM 107340]|uniref:Uncharacterized protein n=1 Tax=Belliella calami TaxID=2923436 RepID=A0ABS9UJN2_9BACT|nr:hypothetical protein [Belliella calami]MCH7396824.1 hypothetical protein [Belliella calami]
MNNLLKQTIGISLTIIMIFHGMVLPYFSVSEEHVLEDSSAYFSSSSLAEYASDLPLVSDTDHLVLVTCKAQFAGDSYIGSFDAINSFHFENFVKTLFKLSQKTDVVFGIKELKFPTHYFW